MAIPVNEYNYKELESAALKFDATQEEISALGEWFALYGDEYWNGECWSVDEKKDLRLYPIYRTGIDGELEITGYTFSSDPDERFV